MYPHYSILLTLFPVQYKTCCRRMVNSSARWMQGTTALQTGAGDFFFLHFLSTRSGTNCIIRRNSCYFQNIPEPVVFGFSHPESSLSFKTATRCELHAFKTGSSAYWQHTYSLRGSLITLIKCCQPRRPPLIVISVQPFTITPPLPIKPSKYRMKTKNESKKKHKPFTWQQLYRHY